ncbi:MAG TPA: hypothetical protein VN426_02150 [Syntrophomonadaceae bacterium]|nr:hypothetical protein [Syntrophomonadaceae bacterium]
MNAKANINIVDEGIDYRHLQAMTDNTGMLQFSLGSNPDPASGYTVDDNARALLVALNIEGPERYRLSKIYTRYLEFCQKDDGSWNNLLKEERFVPGFDSDDSQGRTFLACALASLSDLEDVRQKAQVMMEKALPVVMNLRSPRAMAYTLLGMAKMLSHTGDNGGMMFWGASRIHQTLQGLYKNTRSPGWNWFENSLTYCNGILPHALFAFSRATGDAEALQTAQESLDFLSENLFRSGHLSIIGNQGWWIKGSKWPLYDQQPVDACSMAMACGEAFRVTAQREYLEQTELAYAWYQGKNLNGLSLYDSESGGCYDALTAKGVNLNQGAEAVLSLLLTKQLIKELRQENRRETVEKEKIL